MRNLSRKKSAGKTEKKTNKEIKGGKEEQGTNQILKTTIKPSTTATIDQDR